MWGEGGDSGILSGNGPAPGQVHRHTRAGTPGISVGAAAAERFLASPSVLDLLQPGICVPDQTSQQTPVRF